MGKFEVGGSILVLLLACLLNVNSIRSNWTLKSYSTIIVPDQYSTIQEAINNAVEEDTIFVRAGIYYEHVTIDKSISLIGENKYTTFVDGEGTGSVICVISDNVTVTGFTVQNSGHIVNGTVPDAGISTSHVSDCNISGNLLIDNYVSIFVRPSKNTWFTNNVITHNHIGIDINNQSTHNIISGNSLKGNNVSIHIYYADSNVFFLNNMIDNPLGIVGRYSSNNTFCENEIRNGLNGMILNGADFNNISKNIVSDLQYGIQLKAHADHNLISENSITNCSYAGIDLDEYAGDNSLSNNTIANSEVGIDISNWSVNNTISRNRLTANLVSMHFWYADLNKIFENNITSNYVGVVVLYSQSNRFYHNTFLNNTKQVNVSSDYANFWDDGYPFGGNYWESYNGTDFYRGVHQNETGSDGMGDTPHIIGKNNTDHYPLMKPYAGAHDIGIRAFFSKTIVADGYNITVAVNVTVINYGEYAEAFNFTFQMPTVYYEEELMLESRDSIIFSFEWNTTGFAKGNYALNCNVTQVQNEIDITDNTYVKWIIITIAGDVASASVPPDFLVNMSDIGALCDKFMATPSHSQWDPNYDINDDGVVNMRDINIACSNFMKTWP